MWKPNFGHPLIDFLAWVIILIVVIWLVVFIGNLVLDLFDDDVAAAMGRTLAAVTSMDQ